MSRAASRSVYQIDFTAVACGKRVASSKRRVRWRFGFANAQALAAGMTGTDCRGSEHDVVFVWSISSGKRTVLFDGQEVHYSSSRSGVFDYSWTMRGTNHVLKIVAHASPPMSTTPGFRQYDFFVDGLSFFRFPKVFRLGLNPNDPRAASAATEHSLALRGNRYKSPDEVLQAEIPSNPDEEEAYLQEAIRQSLQDDLPPAKAAPATTDLLGFDSPQVPASAPSQSTNNLLTGSNDFAYGAPTQQQHQQQLALPYNSTYPGAETHFAATQQQLLPPPTQQLALPTSMSTHAPMADPWSAPSASATTPVSYAPQQQQLPMTQLVPAPSSASPYALAANPFGFAAGSDNSHSQVTEAPASAMRGYPIQQQQQQQQQQPPVPYNSALASYGSGTGGGGPTEGSGYASSNPSASRWTPPPPIVTTAPYQMPQVYSSTSQPVEVPTAVSPQAVSTPSTLGFGSPAANFAALKSPIQEASEPVNGNNDQAGGWENAAPSMQATELFSSDVGNDKEGEQPGSSLSLVEEAYSKLVDFETFSISSKKDAPRSNPFEMMSTSVGGTKSLADIQATKTQSGPKKEVMKTPAPAQALASSQQQLTSSVPSGYGQPSASFINHSLPAHQPPQQFTQGFPQPHEHTPQAFVAQQPLSQYQPQSAGYASYNPPPQTLQQQPAEQSYNPMQHQPGYGQQSPYAPQNTYGQSPGTMQSDQPANLSYF